MFNFKSSWASWYWSYEYTDFGKDAIMFDSYMLDEADLAYGELRLLEVDNRVVLPVGAAIRLVVTSVMYCIVLQFLLML